jgi:choline dehydrogenase-like flavoprotein
MGAAAMPRFCHGYDRLRSARGEGDVADYVIVGGGTAGCALAARLSEDDVSVVLLEAGPPDDLPEIHVPAMLGFLFKTHVDWDLHTDPEPALDRRRGYLPRGRMLGGSGSINGMVYIRGNRADFEEWAQVGGEGWGPDHVLPYFKRSEDNERGADEFHGVGGPLGVSDGRSGITLPDLWVEAAVEAGFAHTADFNAATQEGVGRYQVMQRDGQRSSSASAFLTPALGRPNLEVVTDAHATRLRIARGRATGVEVLRGGRLETVHAEREVIVCAGAYGSPQLLMLSGVGPGAHLSAFGIEVHEDLPVGENLLDHPCVLMSYLTTEPGLFSAFTPENRALYDREHRGPFASNLAEAGGFVSTRPGLPGPDVQFHAGASTYHDNGLGVPFADGQSFGPNVAKPTSRGTVTLRSPMPTAKPRILHNFLATEEDRRTMVEGIRIALRIADQPALRAIRAGVHQAPASDSEDDIMDFVRRNTQTNYHAVGTCAMGSVVDGELRVLGVEGLRVADASVMPTIVRGNTNAATLMIAEKAADLIRGRPAPPPGSDPAAVSARD